MSKQEEGNLILRLYELRRDPTMRTARDWFFRDFHPQTMDDYNAALFSEHSGHVRMVMTYWDMAAALVKHGAIDADFFADTNGELFSMFAKVEQLLPEIRAAYGEQNLANAEAFVDSVPDGRKRVAAIRERIKGMREKMAAVRTTQQP